MSTRDRIVRAAARVIRERGLARATTKEIARAADLSEAAIYRYFHDKHELFLAVLHEDAELAPFVRYATRLPGSAGEGTVESNLREVARQALAFYAKTVVLGGALFAEPELLAQQRKALRAAGAGPHRANELVAEYLRAEQRLGRVAEQAQPQAAAALLLGACFHRAFLRAYMGRGTLTDSDEEFVTELARTVTRSLQEDPGQLADHPSRRSVPGPGRL